MNSGRDDAGRGTSADSSSARPGVAVVGAGAVGTALGVAISRAGWPVVAVISRDATRRDRFVALVPGARAFGRIASMPGEVGLVIVAVPDDAIADVAAEIPLQLGRAAVHTSGALGAEVLADFASRGGAVGAFHPLVSFTLDVERSVAGIVGATIAIEGDDRLIELLADLAESLGARPIRLPPGTKSAYHAAAVLASGGLVALLDAIAVAAATLGLDERDTVAVYGRLVEQTLANARTAGIAASLTGPITRGDVGTIAAHMAVLEARAPDVVELYAAAARRQLRIAEERGALSPDQAVRVRDVLAKGA